MAGRMERWRTLEQLDEWLRTPMLLLSLVWLIIVVVELTRGTSALLTTIGTAIWIVFIAEFAVRFALAPGKRTFLRHNWLTLIALIVPAQRGLERVHAAVGGADDADEADAACGTQDGERAEQPQCGHDQRDQGEPVTLEELSFVRREQQADHEFRNEDDPDGGREDA